LRRQFITVVSEYMTCPVSIAILIASPALFILVETIFFHVITHESPLYLGFFGRFHKGLWLFLDALGAAVSFCFEHDMDGDGGNLSAPLKQASPPPPYFVNALSSISFTAHQDHIMQVAPAFDSRVLRDDEKMV
jgi:hypothetical protein